MFGAGGTGATVTAAGDVANTNVADLFLEFGLLLIGLGILARLAHRIGFSPVPLFIIAGLFFGEGGVIGIPASDAFVATVAELGVVILLLLLGLEYSGRDLVSSAAQQRRSAVLDLVANAAPGAILALILGWGWVGALALGGVTYISSSGIVSQVLRDFRWRRNPESRPVVSILVIEDLVMAPYLPVLTVVLTGTGLAAGLISVSVGLVIVALVIGISARGIIPFQRVLDPRDPVGLLLIVFGAAIAAAGLAGVINFSPAVAAFLVGLLLTDEVADMARRRLDPLRDVLAAVFFTYFGLSTDPGEIPGVLLPAAVLAVVTIATKFWVGWVAGSTVETPSRAGRLRAGALLSARGEFSVVIAGIVLASGVLLPSFAALVATYVLITATAAPLLARGVEMLARRWTHGTAPDVA